MKKIFLFLSLSTCALQAQYLLKNVNIITLQDSSLLRSQDIVFKNGEIADYYATGSKKHQGKETIIDCKGAYLMPGFWDMHAHLPVAGDAFSNKEYLQMMLEAGITGIRSMRGTPGEIILRDSIQRGELNGPELFISAVLPEGDSLKKPQQLNRFFDVYTEMKYDFVKYLGGLDSVQMKMVSDQCKAKGIMLCGHAYKGDLDRSMELGFRSVEHYQPILKKYNASPETFGTACTEMKNKHVFLSPTFSFYHIFGFQFSKEELNKRNGMDHLSEGLKNKWNREIQDFIASQLNGAIKDQDKQKDTLIQKLTFEKLKAKNKDNLNKAMQAIKTAHAHGVPVLLSADDGIFNVPGYALYEEMKIFAEAGFSPYSIYRMATVNAALFFNRKKQTGTIAKGSVASLCLFEKNPLERIEHAKQPLMVFVNGKKLH